MVPHLVTALTGPINELEQRILDSMPAIERWFRLEWMEHTPPFYCSVDIRNAGFKLAPVDTNLFPGGWNNLTDEMLPLAVQAAMAAIEKICPEARNLLIIPENHTRNTHYLASVLQLKRIFSMAGLNVRIGSISPEIKKTLSITLPLGDEIKLEPVIRTKRRLGLKDFDPCTILLNNDLSTGVPGIIEELYEQYLLPPLHAGWNVRRKSRHFQSYEEVSKRFGKLLGIDPLLGIMAGAVSLEGGFGAAAAFGPIAENLGAVGATTAALAAATFGMVAGGLLGSAAESGLTKTQGVEITVREDDGSTRAYVQQVEPNQVFRTGERVRIMTVDGTSRVTQ